jgi:hypothetical protein
VETAETPFGRRKLGRKRIKSFASGIAHMIARSAQRYAGWGATTGRRRSQLTSWNRESNPLISTLRGTGFLPGCVSEHSSETPGDWRHQALWLRRISLPNFGIDDYSGDGRSASIGGFIFTVALTDDRGKEWRVDHADERMLIQS